MNKLFNSRAVSAFLPIQQKERITALEGLLISPDSYLEHFKRYVRIVYCDLRYVRQEGSQVTTDTPQQRF